MLIWLLAMCGGEFFRAKVTSCRAGSARVRRRRTREMCGAAKVCRAPFWALHTLHLCKCLSLMDLTRCKFDQFVCIVCVCVCKVSMLPWRKMSCVSLLHHILKWAVLALSELPPSSWHVECFWRSPLYGTFADVWNINFNVFFRIYLGHDARSRVPSTNTGKRQRHERWRTGTQSSGKWMW